jgi:hypothetical protein
MFNSNIKLDKKIKNSYECPDDINNYQLISWSKISSYCNNNKHRVVKSEFNTGLLDKFQNFIPHGSLLSIEGYFLIQLRKVKPIMNYITMDIKLS